MTIQKTAMPDIAVIEQYHGQTDFSLLHIWAEYGWGSWKQELILFCFGHSELL